MRWKIEFLEVGSRIDRTWEVELTGRRGWTLKIGGNLALQTGMRWEVGAQNRWEMGD